MGGGGKSTLCTMPTGRGVPISFSKGFGDSSCKLFELEEDVLQELTQPGGSLRVKGAAEEEAVLCTSTST